MRGKSNSSNTAQNQGNYDLTGGMKNSNTYAGGYNNNSNNSKSGGTGNDYLKSIMQKYQKSGLIGSYTAQKKVQNQQQQLQNNNNNNNGGKSPNLLKKSINAGYSSVEKNKKNISLSGNKKDRMSSYEGRRLY